MSSGMFLAEHRRLAGKKVWEVPTALRIGVLVSERLHSAAYVSCALVEAVVFSGVFFSREFASIRG
jgi:hypothetical protein